MTVSLALRSILEIPEQWWSRPSPHLGQILAALDHHSTLTVSQADGAAQRGVMIQLATENSRIRLRINVDSARAAGLTISSKLLRPAEIIGATPTEQ